VELRGLGLLVYVAEVAGSSLRARTNAHPRAMQGPGWARLEVNVTYSSFLDVPERLVLQGDFVAGCNGQWLFR
jgi:hypothetical protein